MLDHDHRELSKIFEDIFLMLTSGTLTNSVDGPTPDTPTAASIFPPAPDSAGKISAGAVSAKELYQKLDLFWARLAVHIRAEHLHMFPALLSANNPELDQAAMLTATSATTATTSVTATTVEKRSAETTAKIETSLKNILDRLKKEHDVFMTGIWTQLKEIKRFSAPAAETMPKTEETNILPDNNKKNILIALRNLETIYHKHNDEEERTIYRWCETFLTQETQSEISEKMKREIEKMPPRFQKR